MVSLVDRLVALQSDAKLTNAQLASKAKQPGWVPNTLRSGKPLPIERVHAIAKALGYTPTKDELDAYRQSTLSERRGGQHGGRREGAGRRAKANGHDLDPVKTTTSKVGRPKGTKNSNAHDADEPSLVNLLIEASRVPKHLRHAAAQLLHALRKHVP